MMKRRSFFKALAAIPCLPLAVVTAKAETKPPVIPPIPDIKKLMDDIFRNMKPLPKSKMEILVESISARIDKYDARMAELEKPMVEWPDSWISSGYLKPEIFRAKA